jgi:phage shock protein A
LIVVSRRQLAVAWWRDAAWGGAQVKTKGTAASMSVMKRVSLIFRAKADKALDRMEDPRETLDYSYKQQVEMLTRVRRGVADVATSRKRVELQMNSLQKEIDKRDSQARSALGAGREDLARAALQNKSQLQSQYTDLEGQFANLQEQEEKLTLASQRLDSKVQAFRTRKETIKATYTAAEAQTRINEAFSGISEEMGDVGLAIQRAEDKTAQMQARAGAIDELLASGALEDHVGGGSDSIQAELDKIGASHDVDYQLAQLKNEIAATTPKQIECNGSAAAGQEAAAAEQQAGDGL